MRSESLRRPSLPSRVGVLLMSFGTAATLADVPAYLGSVRGGRPAPEDLVQEFQRRFARVGGSPLLRITREQAVALEKQLSDGDNQEVDYIVRVGMRHAQPTILDGLRELGEMGTTQVVALIMSPQYSPLIMSGYLRAVEQARGQVWPTDNGRAAGHHVAVAGAWHDEPLFIEAMAASLHQTLAQRQPDDSLDVPVFFTAHSLPKSVADREPGYIEQLRDTARRIADRVGLTASRWQFAYQSAGHTPEPWLLPDVKDLLPEVRKAGHRAAVVAPVQFLADHLEVLYDIDVAAREEAATLGIDLIRTPSLNVDPIFIGALANVVRRTLRTCSDS